FELEHDAGVGLALAQGHALGDHAADPATSVVLQADQGVDDALVAHAVGHAAHGVPGAAAGVAAGAPRVDLHEVGRAGLAHHLLQRRGATCQRPLPAQLQLFAGFAGVAVGGADRAPGPGRITHAQGALFGALFLRAVLQGAVDVPVR